MNFLIRVAQYGVVALTLVTFFTVFLDSWWVSDLLSHFKVQYFICALAALLCFAPILFFCNKKTLRVWSVLSALLLCIHGYEIGAFLIKTHHNAPRGTSQHDLRVMSFNVLAGNKEYEAIVAQVNKANPDILILLEAQRPLTDALRELDVSYPHQVLEPRHNSFGIALYSKYPITNYTVHRWGQQNIPWIEADITQPEQSPYTIYAVHTLPPIIKEFSISNREQLKKVFASASENEKALIAGDFNNTPWSISMKKIETQSKLSNAYRGNLTGTWKPELLGGLLIDHIFTKNMNVVNWKKMSYAGSDHRAIIAEIGLQ